ncbi:MAG TPA: hypothetical protein H9834_05695 [Candidatus Barnesiella excrementavium]|nr:hypothetical protein [Candidatus Barnesiella excrementavium]
MKKMVSMACMGLSFLLLACGTHKQKAESQAPTVVQDGIRFCESTYPYDGGMLIANFGTEQLNPLNTEGKGYILYYKEGKTSTFIPADGNLSAPKGMYVGKGHLFVCDVNKILVYNLDNREAAPRTLTLPEGCLFANDLAAVGDTLYASVTNADKIFKIDISDMDHLGAPVEWFTVPGPNGLLADGQSLYIASYPADGNTQPRHTIYRVADVAAPALEKVIETPGQYDGIAFSADSTALYITNWAPAGLSRVDLNTGTVTPVSVELEQPLVGPADITVIDQHVYIPDLPNSRVVVISE